MHIALKIIKIYNKLIAKTINQKKEMVIMWCNMGIS